MPRICHWKGEYALVGKLAWFYFGLPTFAVAALSAATPSLDWRPAKSCFANHKGVRGLPE
jgi:hypothetical protein